MKIAIVGILLVICGLGIAVLYKKFKHGDQGNELEQMLAPYIDREYFSKLEQREAEEIAMGLEKDETKILARLAKVIEKFVFFQATRDKLGVQLSQAGMKWRPSEFLTMMMALAIFFFLLGMAFGQLLLGNALLLGVPFGITGYFFPKIVLLFKKGARQKRFQGQLVDTLGLISNSLKAGYSFLQAVELVAEEAPTPTKEEFQRLIREHSLGLPLDEAMEQMAKRIESDDFNLTVTVVLIQRQIGGNLAEILENIAATIRERIKLVGTIKALTAQGKMGGTVITALPFGLFGIMYLLNSGVMGMLFEHKLGWILIVIGLIMQSLGAFVIMNMLKVEM